MDRSGLEQVFTARPTLALEFAGVPCRLEQMPATLVWLRGYDVTKEASMLRTADFRDDRMSERRDESGLFVATKAVVMGSVLSVSFWFFTSFLFLN